MTASAETGAPRRPRVPREIASDDGSLNSVEQVTALIRQAIFSGQYGPGERLKVAELSAQFGFSAMPLREALRKLEGEGLVEIEPNRGATVRGFDRRFIEDLYELNAELQILAVRRAIQSLTLEILDELEASAAAYERAVHEGGLEEALRLNHQFHARIVELGGNREALRLFRRGWELMSAFRRRFGYGAGRQLGLVREHRLLIEALRRNDVQLAEAILRMQHAAGVQDLMAQLDAAGGAGG